MLTLAHKRCVTELTHRSCAAMRARVVRCVIAAITLACAYNFGKAAEVKIPTVS